VGGYGPMIAERIMQSAGNAKEHKGLRSEQLEDEQRQAREQQIWQDPGLNTAQKAQGIDMLYAHEPVESRLGRIKRGFERMTGQGKKADEQKKQADSQIASQKESIYGYGSKMDPNYPVKTVTDSAASYTDPNTGVAQTIPGTGATTKIGLAAPNRNIQEGLRGLMAQSNPNLQAQQKADFERSQLAPDKIAQVKAADAALDALGINDPNVRQRARDAALGSKAPNAPYKTYVNKSTGERQAFRVGEQPDEDWEISPTGAGREMTVTVDGKTPILAYEQGGAFKDAQGNVIEGAKPYEKPKTPALRAGTSNGKNVYAILTDKGWIDSNTQQPLRDFRQMPTFAETGLWGVDPVNNSDGTIGSAMVNRRTGQVKKIASVDGSPIAPSLMAQVTKSIEPAIESDNRLSTMQQNARDALAGNQQAMLSLVANHIGMTLGAQKGARINQAVWNEAVGSAPWLQNVEKKFDSDGYLQGVSLSPQQINQMLALGKQKRDLQWEQAQQAGRLYGINVPLPEDLGGTSASQSKGQPAPKKQTNGSGPTDDEIIKALGGK